MSDNAESKRRSKASRTRKSTNHGPLAIIKSQDKETKHPIPKTKRAQMQRFERLKDLLTTNLLDTELIKDLMTQCIFALHNKSMSKVEISSLVQDVEPYCYLNVPDVERVSIYTKSAHKIGSLPNEDAAKKLGLRPCPG